jgi:hypothetical protein
MPRLNFVYDLTRVTSQSLSDLVVLQLYIFSYCAWERPSSEREGDLNAYFLGQG